MSSQWGVYHCIVQGWTLTFREKLHVFSSKYFSTMSSAKTFYNRKKQQNQTSYFTKYKHTQHMILDNEDLHRNNLKKSKGSKNNII